MYERFPLLGGPIASATLVEPATGDRTVLFDTFNAAISPFGFVGDVLYMVRGRRIVAVGASDCSVRTVADRPEAYSIPALVADESGVIWAETYDDLRESRVYSGGVGRTPFRLARTNGGVTWLGLDGRHVYWVEQAHESPATRIVRRLRQ